MNILFLGTFLPTEYEFVNKNISAAGNQFQNNLYNTLKKNNNLIAINHISVYDTVIDEFEIEKMKKENIYTFFPRKKGFLEVLKFRQKVQELSYWADLIITYNVVYPWLFLRGLVKNKKCKTNLILADYTPEYESKGLKKIYAFLMRREFKYYDYAVVLSKNSKKLLGKRTLCNVVNGCIKLDMFDKINNPKINNKIVICYTGYLGIIQGVDLLLEAFNKVHNANIELWLCGQGDELKDCIDTYTKKDQRVKYKGYLKKEDYIDILNQSNVLVNPRNMNYSQNEYNFPSKILEYIASGRVVLSTKFCGYEDYINNIFVCESSIESIKDELEKIIKEYSKIKDKNYKQNVEFAKNFSWDRQINNFYKFKG